MNKNFVRFHLWCLVNLLCAFDFDLLKLFRIVKFLATFALNISISFEYINCKSQNANIVELSI